MSYGQPTRAAPLGDLAKLYLVHGDEAQREAAAALLEQELGASYRRRAPTDEEFDLAAEVSALLDRRGPPTAEQRAAAQRFEEGEERLATVAVVGAPKSGRSFVARAVVERAPVPLDGSTFVAASAAGLVRCAFVEVDAAAAPEAFALGAFHRCNCVLAVYDARDRASVDACLEAARAVTAQSGAPVCLVANFADADDRADGDLMARDDAGFIHLIFEGDRGGGAARVADWVARAVDGLFPAARPPARAADFGFADFSAADVAAHAALAADAATSAVAAALAGDPPLNAPPPVPARLPAETCAALHDVARMLRCPLPENEAEEDVVSEAPAPPPPHDRPFVVDILTNDGRLLAKFPVRPGVPAETQVAEFLLEAPQRLLTRSQAAELERVLRELLAETRPRARSHAPAPLAPPKRDGAPAAFFDTPRRSSAPPSLTTPRPRVEDVDDAPRPRVADVEDTPRDVEGVPS